MLEQRQIDPSRPRIEVQGGPKKWEGPKNRTMLVCRLRRGRSQSGIRKRQQQPEQRGETRPKTVPPTPRSTNRDPRRDPTTTGRPARRRSPFQPQSTRYRPRNRSIPRPARGIAGSGVHRICAGVDGRNSSSERRFGASAHCTSWIEVQGGQARSAATSEGDHRREPIRRPGSHRTTVTNAGLLIPLHRGCAALPSPLKGGPTCQVSAHRQGAPRDRWEPL